MYFGGFLRYRKKKIQVSVCWVRSSGDYDQKKKRYSRLSDGCTVLVITTGKKKDTVVSGNFHYDRKKRYITTEKKKDTVVSGGKLAFFL
jgi:hypothetical protein